MSGNSNESSQQTLCDDFAAVDGNLQNSEVDSQNFEVEEQTNESETCDGEFSLPLRKANSFHPTRIAIEEILRRVRAERKMKRMQKARKNNGGNEGTTSSSEDETYDNANLHYRHSMTFWSELCSWSQSSRSQHDKNFHEIKLLEQKIVQFWNSF